jgi:hypothetical protein
MPAEEPLVPTYLFQHICSNYCTFEGMNYLVTVDRFSGGLTFEKLLQGQNHLVQLAC